MKDKLNYNEALAAITEGKLVSRESWGDAFVFMTPEQNISADLIISSDYNSFPDSLKSYYNSLFSHTRIEEESGQGPESMNINFSSCIFMHYGQLPIISPYVFNEFDINAKDWIILNF